MPLSFSNALAIISPFLPLVALAAFSKFPKEYSKSTLFSSVDLLLESQVNQQPLEPNNLLDSSRL